jgi:hypothetical protein
MLAARKDPNASAANVGTVIIDFPDLSADALSDDARQIVAQIHPAAPSRPSDRVSNPAVNQP